MFLKTTFAVFLLAAALIPGAGVATSFAGSSTVEINLVSMAAWTGEVDPLTSDAGPAGGAAALATYWHGERAANPNTIVLGTGNSFGTSPPIANLFDDEPAVLAMNRMGFDADALGNDNFGNGVPYLQRLLRWRISPSSPPT